MTATMPWIRALLLAATAAGLAAQKTPEEALRALTDGNRRFAADKSIPQPVGEGVRRTLARGQSPFAVVLCCSDSRVPPEHIFNCGLGELFVIRIAGNACDRETLASIEYAVEHLGTPLCVVLGHESCGAVSAAIEQVQALDLDHSKAAPSAAIQGLIEQIEPAVRKARAQDLGGKALHDACEEENVHRCLHECLRRSPMLQRYVQVGKLQMVGARYHLDSGQVEWLPNRPLPPEPRFATDHTLDAVPVGVPPHVALRMLQAGHRRFLGDSLPAGDLSAGRRESLTHGQQPLAIVLTCADSRVAPEHVFDSGLGELFVVRVAGNVVNDDVLASVEYAASRTGASLLVVMGHTRCGALTAAVEHPESQNLTPNMRALLTRLEPSVERVRGHGQKTPDIVELAVTANVLRASAELRSRSAILRELETRGRFAILPTVYDIASGNLTWLKDVPDEMPAAAPGGETKSSAKANHDHGTAGQPAGTHADDGHGATTGVGGGRGKSDEHDGHGAATPAQGNSGHEQGHDHVPNVVLDWDAPPPAHATAGHGTASHGTTALHGHGGHGDDGHGHDTKSDGHASGHEAGHTTSAGHGDAAAHGHGQHDTKGHGDEAHVGHAAESADHDAHPKSPKGPWQNPIVIIGLVGVGSLLLAAMIAMLKRD